MADSHLLKRSMQIGGRKTSIALELAFWTALDRIARIRGMSLPTLLADISKQRRPDVSLASAARVFALLNAPAPSRAVGAL